jgi:putative heme iron utilization protein
MSPRAQKARSLLEGRRFGVLTTISKRMPGYPFGSIAPFSVDDEGRPLLLLSGLAVHTKNLDENAKASLLVFDKAAEEDPLGSARMNLMGEVDAVPEPDLAAARAAYVKDHPESEQWLDFGDFQLYRLAVADVYYIGGFGEMGWVSKDDFAEAKPE